MKLNSNYMINQKLKDIYLIYIFGFNMKILSSYLSLMESDMRHKFLILILLSFLLFFDGFFGLAMILPVIKVILKK